MLKIRQLFNGSEVRDPGNLADDLARGALGHGTCNRTSAYRLGEAINIALRRGISRGVKRVCHTGAKYR